METYDTKTYELNGAGAESAMLWFLMRERQRHFEDITVINVDILALIKKGVILPETPSLDTFITVPGVRYDNTIASPEHTVDEIIYPPIAKGKK
jgi:hypothetical protein